LISKIKNLKIKLLATIAIFIALSFYAGFYQASYADEGFLEKFIPRSQRLLTMHKHKVEISVKILDANGNPFAEEAELALYMTLKDPKDGSDEKPIRYLAVKGGCIQYALPGSVYGFAIEARKKGFQSTRLEVKIDRTDADPDEKIEGLSLYLIDDKHPVSKLESIDNGFAIIPIDKSGGVSYGWSFSKKWYFPSAQEEADMARAVDSAGTDEYTMKGSGGFIPFENYPVLSDRPHITVANIDLMAKAPQTGYISTIVPEKDKSRYSINSPPCYYFRTPDGRYGKIEFGSNGRFRYRIQPDGSTNLYSTELKYKYAVR